MDAEAELDRRVRSTLYHRFVTDGHAPVAASVARDLGVLPADVEGSLRRLHEQHIVVLAPNSTYVWMANPLSALPTAYRATVDGRGYWGNCVWDGFGIIAMLGGTGRLDALCPDCGESQRIDVEDGVVADDGRPVHFAVQARHWWDAIGFS